jgi:hypothetical protein
MACNWVSLGSLLSGQGLGELLYTQCLGRLSPPAQGEYTIGERPYLTTKIITLSEFFKVTVDAFGNHLG